MTSRATLSTDLGQRVAWFIYMHRRWFSLSAWPRWPPCADCKGACALACAPLEAEGEGAEPSGKTRENSPGRYPYTAWERTTRLKRLDRSAKSRRGRRLIDISSPVELIIRRRRARVSARRAIGSPTENLRRIFQ